MIFSGRISLNIVILRPEKIIFLHPSKIILAFPFFL